MLMVRMIQFERIAVTVFIMARKLVCVKLIFVPIILIPVVVAELLIVDGIAV